jgi:hypothetical protein
MGVTMDPQALGGGATEFANNADALLGHVTSVADLAALRAAFAVAGEAAWPGVEACLTELTRRLETAQQRTMHIGTVLRTAATGSTAIDHNNGNTMRM